MPDDDFLSDVWKVLTMHVGTSVADLELLQLRQRWGGSRPYIKKAPSFPTQKQLGEHVASGLSLRDAFSSAGCSPAWGHRLLNRPLRR